VTVVIDKGQIVCRDTVGESVGAARKAVGGWG
jgi:hypothetical protein